MITRSIAILAAATAMIAAGILLTAGVPQNGSAQLAAMHGGDKPTLAPLMRKITPAVVNIAVVGTARPERNPLLDDPFFRRFFEAPELPGQPRPQQGAGSGVIVDAVKGYVLTNHHVVENAEDVTVTLADRRQLRAKLVGSDGGTDIALLQIEANGLTALELGDSHALEVGDFVVAVGNPFGLGQTVTSGIVSALGRAGLGIESYEDFIQTDAPINPGNSGGALVDLDGKLVGINSAIVSPTGGGNVGIGFAVPSDMARSVMEQLVEYGEVRRGRLGIMIQDLTPALAEALEIDADRGAIVTSVEPGSAAERAGLQAGDVVTTLNGLAVEGSTDLRNRIGLMRAGETVKLGALRDSGTLELEARIGEGEAVPVAGTPASRDKLDGAELRDLVRGDPLFGTVEGVLVTEVGPASRAWRSGLRAGDVILAVNRRAVRNIEELSAALRETESTFALDIRRGDARMFIVVQ
jgi:serine protease DegQ